MSSTVRVYVNGRGVDAPSEATVLDAVRVVDAALAEAVGAGDKSLTDSQGLPLAPETRAFTGAIIRVVSGRRAGQPRA